jgi:hypothetical protein
MMDFFESNWLQLSVEKFQVLLSTGHVLYLTIWIPEESLYQTEFLVQTDFRTDEVMKSALH